jgi:hypothetical protein
MADRLCRKCSQKGHDPKTCEKARQEREANKPSRTQRLSAAAEEARKAAGRFGDDIRKQF